MGPLSPLALDASSYTESHEANEWLPHKGSEHRSDRPTTPAALDRASRGGNADKAVI